MASHAHPVASLPVLTALRGLAALWVLFHHLYWEGFLADTPLSHAVALKGYMAVEFFFVLSGFVVSFSYTKLFVGVPFNLKFIVYFYGQRFFRIYPLHLFLLGLVLLTLLFKHNVTNNFPESVISNGSTAPFVVMLSNITLTQAWWLNIPSIIVPAWSASTEILASILFPVLIVLVFRVPVSLLWLVAMCIFAGVLWLIETNPGHQLSIWYGWRASLRCLLEFCIGILCYRTYRIGFMRRFFHLNIVGVSFAASFVIACWLQWYDFISFFLVPFVIITAAHNQTWLKNTLELPLLQWLGEISFSIYLTHFVIIHLFSAGILAYTGEPVHPSLLVSCVCASAVIIISYFCYQAIEMPSRRFGRKLLQPLRLEVIAKAD